MGALAKTARALGRNGNLRNRYAKGKFHLSGGVHPDFQPQGGEDLPPTSVVSLFQKLVQPVSGFGQPQDSPLLLAGGLKVRQKAVPLLGHPSPLSLEPGESHLKGFWGAFLVCPVKDKLALCGLLLLILPLQICQLLLYRLYSSGNLAVGLGDFPLQDFGPGENVLAYNLNLSFQVSAV